MPVASRNVRRASHSSRRKFGTRRSASLRAGTSKATRAREFILAVGAVHGQSARSHARIMAMSETPPESEPACRVCGGVLLESASGVCVRCSSIGGAQGIDPANESTAIMPPRDASAAPEAKCVRCGSTVVVSELSADSWCERCRSEAPTAGPETAFTPPAELPGYRMLRRLGSGGMGVIWLAEQRATKQTVAIKFCREDRFSRDASSTALRRFEREMELAARLSHPHIARIFGGGDIEGIPYCVIEYVEGLDLAEYVCTHRLDREAVVALMVKVAEAVQHAHQNGIIHRDLKPSNILVNKTGEPKILDFGLAKALEPSEGVTLELSLPGQLLGTPRYMAPEQVRGTAVGTRTDVYALGVILCELLTGEHPHESTGSREAFLHRIATDEPRRPRTLCRDLDGELEMLLLKTLSKNPDDRYRTAGGLADDLGRWLRDESLTAGRATSLYFARKWVRRHRAPAATVLLVAGVVGGLGWYAWQQRSRAEAAEKESQRAWAMFANQPGADSSALVGSNVYEVALRPRTQFPAHTPAPVSNTPKRMPPRMTPSERPVPVQPRVAQSVPPPASPLPPEASLLPTTDWSALVTSGDDSLRRRRTDDAIDAYASALEVAHENPKIAPLADYGRVCLSLSSLQLQNGSPAEARRTLIEGRKFLIAKKSPASTIEQVENVLRKIPREDTAPPIAATRPAEASPAEMKLLGDKVRESDPAAAFKWYSTAAAKNYAPAQTQLGLMLANGAGIAQPDLAKAVQSFRAAANQGDAAGKFALGECFLLGLGVAKDEARAVALLREAADAGNARAMNRLGDCATRGLGMKPDHAEAFRLFSQAAGLGNLQALGNLGVLYMTGRGVPATDLKKGAELFAEGARAGDATSMFNYARCLEEGIGVAKNPLQAKDWYRQAATAGDKRAIDWCQKHSVPFTPR